MSEPESDYGEEEVEDEDYEDRSPSPNYWWPPSPKDSDEDDVDDEEDEDLPHLDGYLDGSGISICHFSVFFRTTKN